MKTLSANSAVFAPVAVQLETVASRRNKNFSAEGRAHEKRVTSETHHHTYPIYADHDTTERAKRIPATSATVEMFASKLWLEMRRHQGTKR
jgi:hypothetical protein